MNQPQIKVRMLSKIISTNHFDANGRYRTFEPGEVVDIEKHDADAWIESGTAELAQAPSPAA